MWYLEFLTSKIGIWKIVRIPVLTIGLSLVLVIQAFAEESLAFKLGLLSELTSNKNISD